MLGKMEGRRRRGRQGMRWLEGITDAMDLNLSKFPKIGEDRGAGQVQFMESRSQTQQLGSNSPWPADGGRTPLCLSNQAPGHKLIKSGARPQAYQIRRPGRKKRPTGLLGSAAADCSCSQPFMGAFTPIPYRLTGCCRAAGSGVK